MNVIRVLDSTTYAEIASIENVISPLITEEINGVFNFEFETIYDEISKFASGGNIISIEDDYFRIATTTKNLDGTYRVFAEHVSFALTRAFFEDYVGEGIEGTASEILTPMLDQIGWGIGSIVETPVKYYKPSQGTSVRKQILDIANLFGLETIWDKFSVSLVEKRGSQQLTEFKLGENLLGVSETIDLTGEYPETSYEVDVLDLSQLDGYENFKKINLGDVVHVIAQNIDLEGISRVVYRQYNPFEKVNVNLQIGFVAREFTNYERDEEDEEDDETASYLLSEFKIGQVDCLKLSGVEMDYESVLPDDVSADVDYFVHGEHKGVSIALQSQYSDYIATVTKFYEDGSYIDYNLSGLSETLKTWNLPEKNLVALTVTVSPVPINEVDPDIHKVAIYGVTFNKTYIDPIREFKVGKQNILKLNALIDTDGENLNIEEDITAVINYSLLEEHKGMKLSIKREFKDYFTYITLLDENGLPTQYEHEYEAVKGELGSWNFPKNNAHYILVTVQEKPTGEFDASVHTKVMYGVKFEYIPIDPLQVFKIGDEDCLLFEGVMSDKEPTLDEYLAEIFYDKMDQHKGLHLSLKREFSSYHVSIKTISENGATTEYDLSTVQNQIVNWSFPTENIMYVLIAVSQVSPDEFDPTTHRKAYYAIKFVEDEKLPEPWLSEFKIGTEDCLMLPGVMIDDADAELITAELNYTKDDEYTGLFLKLEEKYREATISVTDGTGKSIDYSDTTVLPNGIEKILVTVTHVNKKQYYGLKFVQADFVGLITIKSKDEDGNIIATREQTYTETGVHEIIADEIYGYELISESPVNVELTVKEPEKVVEFIYKDVGGGNSSKNGYTLEFGTTSIAPTVLFHFENDYDSIESIITGVIGSNAYRVISAEKISENGKYIGVKITTTGATSGADISVQAVCYRAGGSNG